MPRLTALLLCALAALVATATPAPEPKPWVTGWDKPVDPKGDCRFERKGERLTIAVPGPGHELNLSGGVLNAPRLLRDVEGDFDVEVRVSVDSSRVRDLTTVYQQAGILAMDGEKNPVLAIKFLGQVDDKSWPLVLADVKLRGGQMDGPGCGFRPTSPPGRSVYLRVNRQGNSCRLSCSREGKQWHNMDWPRREEVNLPRKLKLGVFAAATAEGEFKVTFDHLKLSRPGH